MTAPLEHHYIGLTSEVSSNGSSSTVSSEDSDKLGSLKETELRLGIPGSRSPDRANGPGLSLGIAPNRIASGSKRGFSDAIDGSGMWVFSGGTGSEEELEKGGALFSPKGGESAGAAKNLGSVGGLKDDEKKALAPSAPAAKAQVVGWPPIRSYRKNTMAANSPKNKEDAEGKQGLGLYVKVSMDGAPYLRKVDLKTYSNYKELSLALEKMFSCFTIGQCGSHGAPARDGLSESRLTDLIHGSEYVLTYEDKDGDWMLVGDVPWDMFTDSCRRLRIMKGSDAIGLAPRVVEKSKNRN